MEDVARVVTCATEDVLEPNVGCGVVSISEGTALTDLRSTIGTDGEAGLVRGSIMLKNLTNAVCVTKEKIKYATPVKFGNDPSKERGTESRDSDHPTILVC